MDEYSDGVCISTERDRIYSGKWRMDLEAEVAVDMNLVKDEIGLIGYRPIDSDDHGFTYDALGDPDLWIDVDRCEDCRNRTHIAVHKVRVDEQGVASAMDYLAGVYLQITQGLAATMYGR